MTSLELIELAPELMADHQNYFGTQNIFCNGASCTIVNSEKRPLTNDMLHLTEAREELMMRKLFENPKFLYIWETSDGLSVPNFVGRAIETQE